TGAIATVGPRKAIVFLCSTSLPLPTCPMGAGEGGSGSQGRHQHQRSSTPIRPSLKSQASMQTRSSDVGGRAVHFEDAGIVALGLHGIARERILVQFDAEAGAIR